VLRVRLLPFHYRVQRLVLFVFCRSLLRDGQPGLQKGSWSKEEDSVVKNMVTELGVAKVKWSTIAEQVRPSSWSFYAYNRVNSSELWYRCSFQRSCRDASASSAGSAGSTTWTRPSRRATGRATRKLSYTRPRDTSATGTITIFQLQL